jgi:hypothetical protein
VRGLLLHIALLAAIWLGATLIYVLVFVGVSEPVWLVIDGALVAGCSVAARRLWAVRVVTGRQLVALAVLACGCVVASQLLIADRNGIWLDESNYLATLRSGEILRHGVAPFNLRWLEPFLAGPWNVIAASDADALKAINFGALVVTCVYLAMLLMRLGVHRRLAFASPVFLLCSYLGIYAATNRLVLDPFNYAMFVLVAHALVDRDDARYLPWLLLVAACNSEKVIYWIPLVGVIALLRCERPWTRRDVWASAVATLRAGAPAALYLVAMSLYLRDSTVGESATYVEQLHRIGFSSLSPKIDDPTVAATTMQMLWFPFGGFTVFALFGIVYAERWVKALVIMLLPIMAQTLIAHDAERMTAYAFVVYLPLGTIYLSRAFADLPAALARAFFAALVAVPVLAFYALPIAKELRKLGLTFVNGLLHHPNTFRMAMSATEVLVVGALIWVHFTLYPSRSTQ